LQQDAFRRRAKDFSLMLRMAARFNAERAAAQAAAELGLAIAGDPGRVHALLRVMTAAPDRRCQNGPVLQTPEVHDEAVD
jgi:hypothetical protein